MLTTSSCPRSLADVPFPPPGYGLPVVCAECSGSTDSVNVHIYPKDSESLRTVESTHPSALSSHRKRGAGTASLLHAQPCNGIASGKRLETDGTLYPSNHDRIRAEGALLVDTRGTSFLGHLCSSTALRCSPQPFQPAHRQGGVGLGMEWSQDLQDHGGWECLAGWASPNHAAPLVFTGSSQAAKPSELNNLNLVRASPAGGSLKQLNVLPELSPALLDLQREAEVEQALLPSSSTAQPHNSSHEPKLPHRSLD